MQQNLPVFVSSTFVDLQLHCAAVREAMHRLEVVVRGMEYFGALPEAPKDECLRIMRGCRAYVGIFAMQYGSVDPESGKSFTHLEYKEAQRLKLPSLIYLIDEERQPVLPVNVDVGVSGEKLLELKRELRKRHVVSAFTSPEDLAARISQDLPAMAQRMGTPVDKSELDRLIETLPRVTWLDDSRFSYLKKEIGGLAEPIGSDALLREALEFLLAGDRMTAFYLLSGRTNLGTRRSIDLLMEIEKKVLAVVERGSRALAQQREAAQQGVAADQPRPAGSAGG